jgi:beta-fructofuranosidase
VLGVPARADVVLRADPAGEPLELTLDEDGGRLLTVVVDPAAGELRLTVPDGPGSRAPLRPDDDGAVSLRLLLDAGVVEAFPDGGAVAAARLRPSGGELRLGLSATGGGARLRELLVHGMARVVG